MAAFAQNAVDQSDLDWLAFPYWCEALEVKLDTRDGAARFMRWLSAHDRVAARAVLDQWDEFVAVSKLVGSRIAQTPPPAPVATPPPAPALPPGWVKIACGGRRPFWYHAASGMSRYERPEAPAARQPARRVQSAPNRAPAPSRAPPIGVKPRTPRSSRLAPQAFLPPVVASRGPRRIFAAAA